MDLFIGKLILGGYHSGATPFLRVFNECFATFSNSHLQLSVIIFYNKHNNCNTQVDFCRMRGHFCNFFDIHLSNSWVVSRLRGTILLPNNL